MWVQVSTQCMLIFVDYVEVEWLKKIANWKQLFITKKSKTKKTEVLELQFSGCLKTVVV